MNRALLIIATSLLVACNRPEVVFINNVTAQFGLNKGETILLPVQEDAPYAKLYIVEEGCPPYDILPASTHVDYFIPYTAGRKCTIRVAS